MNTVTTTCLNGSIKVGDLVISIPADEYACLIGTVLKINLVGTPDHDEETDNETDDVHVDFTCAEYSDCRFAEIEEMFTELYGEKKEYAECPLDDVIMAPESLIRIAGIDGALLRKLCERKDNAEAFYRNILFVKSAFALTGYKIMDGDKDSMILRRIADDTDYEIRITELPK
jgi:hypothetical protein